MENCVLILRSLFYLLLFTALVQMPFVQALEQVGSNRQLFQSVLKGSECGKNSSLMGQSFANQNLVRVDLSGCQLQHSDFTKSILTTAKLRSANLLQADFTRAEMTGADLRGANLQEAIFYNAMLSGISFNGKTNFTNAHYNEHTKFPRNFLPQAHGMIFDSIHSIND
jgi:uncharacterized protein YjbI with pentapeptide repeats